MPVLGNIRRGCSTIRGPSDITHLKQLGGHSAQLANHLYMLTVRRESLLNKRESLMARIRDMDSQLKGIEKDIKLSAPDYNRSLGRVLGRKRKGVVADEGGNGRLVRTTTLKY